MMKKITLLLLTLFVTSFGFSQSLPFNFSSANQLMSGDGDAATSIVQDDGNDVLQMIGSGGEWDNAQIVFEQSVDLSDDANNTMTFRIKPINGTGSGIHLLKFENPSAGGDKELEFTTTGTDWQNISLDFPAGLTTYGKMVLFTDKGAGNTAVDTYLIDDIAGGTNVTVEVVLPDLPFNFSSANQLMAGDGDAVTSLEKDGDNDVLQMIGSGGEWDNAQINFANNVDLSDDANNTITFKIKPINGTGSGIHLLKFEQASEGGDKELEFSTTGTEWQVISLDFPAGLSTYNKMVLFTDKGAGNTAVDTYLIDDIAVSSAGGGGGGGSTSEAYCEKVVAHLGLADQTASEIKLTVVNSGASTMKVTIESNNTDAVDAMLIPGDVTGSPTQSAEDTSVAGQISITLTWAEAPPTDVALNLLWSKDSTPGNWQLGEAPTTFKFDASCTTASVINNELLNISMYPNPTASRLNISAPNTIKSAAIYNILGKQVMILDINKNSKSIDVSNLSSGMYLIKYTIDNATGTAKFIKE